jgi:hypothetical protein
MKIENASSNPKLSSRAIITDVGPSLTRWDCTCEK